MIAILKGDNVYDVIENVKRVTLADGKATVNFIHHETIDACEVKEIVIEGVSSVKTLNDAGNNIIDKFKGNDNSSEK